MLSLTTTFRPEAQVAAREVTGHFVPAGALGLADPVRRHEAALTVSGAGAKELQMLLVEASAQRAGVRVEEVEAPSGYSSDLLLSEDQESLRRCKRAPIRQGVDRVHRHPFPARR